MKVTRRDFLKMSGGLAAWTAFSMGCPRLSFASLPTDNRFVLVILRGALDGLAAVPPYGDKDYASMRGALAFHPPGGEDAALDLDGFFGLHPSLEPLMPLYRQKQLAVVHAVASPYRERSHFDAQNLLENGTPHPGGSEGWLNHALLELGANDSAAIAINSQVPLVLQGKLAVGSYAPRGARWNSGSDYMQKMKALYRQDSALSASFGEGVKAQDIAQASLPADDMMAGGKAKGAEQLYGAAQAAAMFLARDDGPRVAVLEAAGWDTHAGQGTSHGALANRLNDLGRGLAALPSGLGKAWDKTIVVVVTEFGRTVHINGTNGTDHGTAGMALVMGAGVRGGRVLGKWPGLSESALYQDRDLMPTTDMRSIFRTVLYSHMRASEASLDNVIFPESEQAGYISDLLA
jgi:uncharacterized protein (DUF1501 family)